MPPEFHVILSWWDVVKIYDFLRVKSLCCWYYYIAVAVTHISQIDKSCLYQLGTVSEGGFSLFPMKCTFRLTFPKQFYPGVFGNLVQHYRNFPKFSDRQVWGNRADPDQTAPRSSLIRVYTVCHSVCIIWIHYSMVKPHSSNFRVIITNCFGVRIFRKFTIIILSPCKKSLTRCVADMLLQHCKNAAKIYRKITKILDTRKIAVITLKVEQDGFSLE